MSSNNGINFVFVIILFKIKVNDGLLRFNPLNLNRNILFNTRSTPPMYKLDDCNFKGHIMMPPQIAVFGSLPNNPAATVIADGLQAGNQYFLQNLFPLANLNNPFKTVNNDVDATKSGICSVNNVINKDLHPTKHDKISQIKDSRKNILESPILRHSTIKHNDKHNVKHNIVPKKKHIRRVGLNEAVVKRFDEFVPQSTVKPSFIKPASITTTTAAAIAKQQQSPVEQKSVFDKFLETLEHVQKKFYTSTFKILTDSSPEQKQENGISFVQSGFFLHLSLIALTATMDQICKDEYEENNKFRVPDSDKLALLKHAASWLPESDNYLKFRWSSRLLLAPNFNVTPDFQEKHSNESRIHISYLNSTSEPHVTAKIINDMIASDSGGAMRDTFEDSELTPDICCVFVTTLYIRGRWRSSPTLLNGSQAFYDSMDSGPKNTRMIKINDIMNYADLTEWEAEAVEVSYWRSGLTLLLVVPRGRTLRPLAARLGAEGLGHVTERMSPRRVALTMPLYTLRMTLLLPNKLRDMGLKSLTEHPADCAGNSLRLTHAVQRLMFWAEAGRNAYKDDGIEWDEPPNVEVVVNRPYVYFVRWHNITLMNGHFAL